jgi:hypothetical protein
LTTLRDTLAAEKLPFRNGQAANRDPRDNYTNGPMPLVHDAHPTAIFRFIDLKQIGEWEDHATGKLLAIPFDIEARSLSSHVPIRAKIFAAVREITQSEEVAVSPPNPEDKDVNTKRVPTTFLIFNLSPTQYETLLQQYTWSSLDITFRVVPLQPSRPSFLFTLTKLFTMATRDIFDLVQSVWQDPETLTFLQSIILEAPPGDRDNEGLRLNDFISSLSVTRLDLKEKKNKPAPNFNVYAKGVHIRNHLTWIRIRAFLANRSYVSHMQGRAVIVIKPFSCGLCHGSDHPRGLCPYPELPGWNGPPRRTDTRST